MPGLVLVRPEPGIAVASAEPVSRFVFDDDAQSRYDDAQEGKEEFRDEGPYGPDDYRASTGIGGFGVEYVTGAQILFVTLRGAVTFTDGMSFEDGIATANQPTPRAMGAAAAINALPAAERAAAVAQWQWTDDEKNPWMSRFESQIETAWGQKFSFHIEKEYWQDIGATIHVIVSVIEGEKEGDDHLGLEVYKVPANFVAGVGVVSSGLGIGGTSWGATNNEMTLNSNDIEPRVDSILNPTIDFTASATSIAPGQTGALDQFAARFKSGTGVGCPRCGADIEGANASVTARIPGEGTDPRDNAEERFSTLADALTDRGFDATRLVYQYGGEGTRASLTVGSGVAQVVAAHEAGHMFGLGDEYATDEGSGIGGTGGPAGSLASHDEPAREGGLPGAVHENNDNIMSWGNAVRPQHYSTFLEALKWVTDVDDWAFGKSYAVMPPGAVDGPLPGRPDDGTRMA